MHFYIEDVLLAWHCVSVRSLPSDQSAVSAVYPYPKSNRMETQRFHCREQLC